MPYVTATLLQNWPHKCVRCGDTCLGQAEGELCAICLVYEQLPLCAPIVADGVLMARGEPIENDRRGEFIEYCDKRCRDAYAAKADWFRKCLNNPDQLAVWINHWLDAWLGVPQ